MTASAIDLCWPFATRVNDIRNNLNNGKLLLDVNIQESLSVGSEVQIAQYYSHSYLLPIIVVSDCSSSRFCKPRLEASSVAVSCPFPCLASCSPSRNVHSLLCCQE